MRRFSFQEKTRGWGAGRCHRGGPWGGGGGDTLRGRGSPRGNLSHRAGTFRIDLLEGFPNSFPNIAPRVAACLRRVPFTALSSSRGTTATPPQPCPAAGRKPGVCVGSHAKHAWKLRGRGRAPPAAALRLSRVSSRFFGDRMGCFGPFSPAVISGPFPEWGIFPAALPRRQRERLRISALTHAA